jgi:hypothetical protein
LVVSLIEERFSTPALALAPDTDLVALCTADPEELEWVLAELQRTLRLVWPAYRDGRGHTHRLQLFLPEELTIADLCAVIDAGAWPAKWTRPGARLLPFIRP